MVQGGEREGQGRNSMILPGGGGGRGKGIFLYLGGGSGRWWEGGAG